MTDRASANILVVDDEPFMLDLNRRALTQLGFNAVTTCDSAGRALEAIDAAVSPVDLILLDINMPDMDGMQLVRHLVERGFRGSLILVSGEDERMQQAAEKLIHAHRIKTLGHLHKPIQPRLLAGLLENWKPATGSEHANKPQATATAPAKKQYSAEEVRTAIANDELVNFYQPKVSIATRRLVGVETLVRWRHPLDGMVFPDGFIDVAEAHGLIADLTRKVISGALSFAKSWFQQTGSALEVAVNVSMDDLVDLDFADQVARAAEEAGVSAKDVTLEVTESRLMQDLRGPLEVLTRLRLKRFRLSIDDFGTGHSSLAQLRDMPFHELKIDRGFVHGAGTDPTLRAIFEASVTLAKQLGLQIVAEGIEDQADWNLVEAAGCDTAQGYFIARPMAAEALPSWVVSWNERAVVDP